MVRPVKDLDEKQIFELASMHCSMKEIAAVMDCSVDTLDRRYAEIISKGRETGKMRLRGWQLKAAENGNATMLIWLGKQILGQKEVMVEIGSPETIRSLAAVMDQLAQMQQNRQNAIEIKIEEPEDGNGNEN